MCDMHLNDGALICNRSDEHTTHVYAASWFPEATSEPTGHREG